MGLRWLETSVRGGRTALADYVHEAARNNDDFFRFPSREVALDGFTGERSGLDRCFVRVGRHFDFRSAFSIHLDHQCHACPHEALEIRCRSGAVSQALAVAELPPDFFCEVGGEGRQQAY